MKRVFIVESQQEFELTSKLIIECLRTKFPSTEFLIVKDITSEVVDTNFEGTDIDVERVVKELFNGEYVSPTRPIR